MAGAAFAGRVVARAFRFAAGACVLGACQPSSESPVEGVRERETPESAARPVIALPAPRVDPGADREAGKPSSFSSEWLRTHGIAHWEHDRACWRSGSGAVEAVNACACEQSLTLATFPPVDLLVCARADETGGTYVPWVTRSIVYVADKGHMRAVLDVPTHAATDSDFDVPGATETAASYAARFVGMAAVRIGVDGSNVVIVDASPGHSCGDAVAAGARAKLGDLPKQYASVCASIGQWRWNGAGLTRLPPPRQGLEAHPGPGR